MNQFARTELLLGSERMERLAASHVAVFGIGGVGGYVAEALARSGIGELTLVDPDQVSETNLNRQIIALHSTLGRNKAEVMAERIRDIHPGCRVHPLPVFFLPDTAGKFDFKTYDYVVDAIDTVTGKLALISAAKENGIPVISCMGAGNKLDPSAFRVTDISKTRVCPLAKVMRRELKKRGIKGVKVVYSEENPVLRETGGDPEHPGRRSIPGSIAFVPGAAGLVLAGAVLEDLVSVPEKQ